jgi:predicted membrane metal-binding protein
MSRFLWAMGLCLVLSFLMSSGATTILGQLFALRLRDSNWTPEQIQTVRREVMASAQFLFPYLVLHSFTLYSLLNLVHLAHKAKDSAKQRAIAEKPPSR